jgi:hypothetical protein
MTFTVALCHGGMGCLFMEHADFSSPFVTSVVSRDAWEERKFVCIVLSSVTSSNGTGNDSGVPHSMLSHANKQELQGDLYWIDDLAN